MDTIFKKSSVSISNLESELYTFSSINHIRYKYLHFRQGSEMIYLVFVDHLQCVKNSDKKWWRGRRNRLLGLDGGFKFENFDFEVMMGQVVHVLLGHWKGKLRKQPKV